MAIDVYEAVRQCDVCARNRIADKRHTNPLQLFPANRPLESVAMDILGPLPRKTHVNRFLLVIADRFSKVTIIRRNILLRPMGTRIWSPYLADYRQWATVCGETLPGSLRGVRGK
jgi:hypothetical protein